MTGISMVHGTRVLACPPDGTTVHGEHEAMDVIADALQQGAEVVVLPVQRLTDDFFTLRTRVAGEIVQKFVNYRLRLAVVGDISPYTNRSTTLRDFVYEANRGDQLWFLATEADLDAHLVRAQRRGGGSGP